MAEVKVGCLTPPYDAFPRSRYVAGTRRHI